MNNEIQIVNTVQTYNTRLHRLVKQHNLECYKKKSTCKENDFFDRLQQIIKQEKNLNKLLCLLEDVLIKSLFYSVQVITF